LDTIEACCFEVIENIPLDKRSCYNVFFTMTLRSFYNTEVCRMMYFLIIDSNPIKEPKIGSLKNLSIGSKTDAPARKL
jgi:hypothetical protein